MKVRSIFSRYAFKAIGLACALNVSACRDETFPSRAVLRTDANTPALATRDQSMVELYLQERPGERVTPFYGETWLSVPKAYLHGGEGHWEGHVDLLGKVSIEAALPEMKPWTVYGEDLFEQMKESQKQLLKDDEDAFRREYMLRYMQDSVLINVRYGNCFGDIKSMPKWLEKHATKNNVDNSPLFEKFDWGHQSSRRYYIPKEQAVRKTYIDCPDYGGKVRRCKGITDYDALVHFEYWFSISRLNEYKDIEEKSRKLIAAFIKKNQPTAAIPASCIGEVISK